MNRHDPDAEFEGFVATVEPRLRRALVARYGVDRGRDATAEALGWAWAHWPRVQALRNPVGYLYRVGQSRTRRRREPFLVTRESADMPWVEPALAAAISGLTESQRVAVLLVHGFGWTTHDVAEVLGVKATTVQTHLARGLERLRAALEVEHEH